MSPRKKSKPGLSRRDLLNVGLPQLRDPFRGSATDYCRGIVLGQGYDLSKVDNLCRNCRSTGASSCRHFEIDTCRQLIGPFAAETDPNVETVMNLKAAQTLGSLNWDVLVQYLLVHTPYSRIIIFLENDQKAKTYCDSRLMPTLKANPDLAPILPEGVKRFDDTKTDIIFKNGKMIRVCGLNETNASSLTWQVVIIDEGWQHASDGLIQKAIDRAKQVANRIVLVVGQAGLVGEDQDRIWQRCRQIPVTWKCPFCGGPQTFGPDGPTVRRPDDFKPVEPKLITPGSPEWSRLFAGVAAPPNDGQPPVPGSYCGLKTPKTSKEIAGDTEAIEVASKAWLECYHCGTAMPDTKAIRQKLMESYEQEYRDVTPFGKFTPPGLEVGFWNPEPVSITVPFRDTMRAFLMALKASESGNYIPLQIFYMSRWAKAWDRQLTDNRRVEVSSTCYETDPEKMMPDFFGRYMGVDSQKDLSAGPREPTVGSFWWVIREFDRNGNSRQLARGFADTWEKWIAEQRRWKVSNQCVAIDSSWGAPQIERRAASEFEMMTPKHPHPITGRRDPYPSCWRLFFGSDKGQFRVRGKLAPISEGYESRPYMVTSGDRQLRIKVFKYWWSNFAFEQQLDALVSRVAGMPKFEVLDRAQSSTPDIEVKDLTYERQMSARYPQKVRGKDKYVDVAGRKAHYRDCELEILARASQDGLLGHVQAAIEAPAGV